MNIEGLFAEALGIISPWYIRAVKFDSVSKKLDIEVDFKRGSTFALEDKKVDVLAAKKYKAYDTVRKTWRHLNFFEHDCYLHARTPRIKTEDGKVKLISPPWSGLVKGFSFLFEGFLLKLCRNMPVHQVNELLKVSDHKIWTVLDTYVHAAKSQEDHSDGTVIGIDETSIAKGHEYISLFVDLEKKKTIFITDGKNNQTVVDFGKDLKKHKASPEQIKEVSCDMSPAFIKGVGENLPNAKITFDKFHILKIINAGVDQVRREEAATNPLLKKNR